MITSTRNPKIQWVRNLQSRAKARREEQAFVVEGIRLAEEALDAGWEALLILHSEDLSERGQAAVAGFAERGAQVEQISRQMLSAVASTQTPQGLLVVLPLKTLPLPTHLDFVFIPAEVRDPGNLGTMLRTATAAGVQAVFLPPATVDVFSPKVVRAGMGAHFRLPIFSLSWEALRAQLNEAELRVYLAAAGMGDSYIQADLQSPLALIVGGEAEGAGEAARGLTHAYLHIPMPGGTESLNAGVAAGLLLFEVLRQRGRLGLEDD
jgi:RNA methyltransferase, TrmH family